MANKPRPQKAARERELHPDARKSIWAVVLFVTALILILAFAGKAGPVGEITYSLLLSLVGWGYLVLPAAFILTSVIFLTRERENIVRLTLLGAGLLVLSTLGLLEIISPGHGGWLGLILGSLKHLFGEVAATVINIALAIISVILTLNIPVKIKFPKREKVPVVVTPEILGSSSKNNEESEKKEEEPQVEVVEEKTRPATLKIKKSALKTPPNYAAPPLSLLKSASEKPTTGDLLANANVIKRTLDGFGIPVEMGEVSVGPAVTRYTLKPAEGVKLSRITALNQDLALALAAHPIRIEAPIPGKSLVGVEVPNKAAALVRLGSLMGYPEFQKSGALGFVLGRDVSGEPVFVDIDKMPHLLIAGATGSGKSISIHSLLISLLYKNSPATLKLILVDPKRVELSVYEGLPHLASPVITESKKAIGVFKWAISEMERRYDLLLRAGSRDIKSYNVNGGRENPLSYLLIVVDELADLMTSYGREVEGSVVRLAQMARATGLHLVLSTQRPSVEVITGLIKANITSRVALQVASQIDSRTILDTSGAEKLLGRGDLLYISSDLSKPKRIQGSYIAEDEIKKVAEFIRDNNKSSPELEEMSFSAGGPLRRSASEASGSVLGGEDKSSIFDEYLEDEEDELYAEAVQIVSDAQKASASLLQRRLKVGYARAARLLDLMEGNGIIGPGDGAKPREVFLDRPPKNLV